MAIFYGYTAIFGTQSTVDGATFNYAFAPTNGGDWSWTGETTSFAVQENDGATVFNGDGDVNEEVDANERIGGAWEQTVQIDGSAQQVIWDYTFEVTAADGTVYRIAVIDVDLNNDNDLNDTIGGADEDGYYLIFPDGVPPAGVDYTIGGIVENDDSTPHVGLGATVVCFSAGTLIETPDGPRPIEQLQPGDMVMTKDDGPQELIWTGARRVAAQGDLAPIVIREGALGNNRDLVVSPQHRLLLGGWQAQLHFGAEEVLVKAKDLIDGDGIQRRVGGMITYHHILCDAHQVVFAEGIPAESFHPGPQALPALDPGPREELLRLFPDLQNLCQPAIPAARMSLKGYEASLL